MAAFMRYGQVCTPLYHPTPHTPPAHTIFRQAFAVLREFITSPMPNPTASADQG